MKLLTRKNNRLKNHDYSLKGYYFITICSKDRQNIFGEHKNIVGEGLAPSRYRNKIKLSPLGEIIKKQWNDIPNQYDNIKLDKYVIMPNHIHGILIIDCEDNYRTAARAVPTISSIIGSYKSKCSVEYLKYIKGHNLYVSGKIWQRSFYDHIIRNERSLTAIREYITNNPINWATDENNLINHKLSGQTCLAPTG